MRRVGGILLGFVLFANIPWVLLMVTGAPVTDGNRSWVYGLLVFAAVAGGLILAVRGVVRRVRGRSPALPSQVVASSIALGFALMALLQIGSIQPNRPELAAALQNLIVAIAAAIWWVRTARRAEQRSVQEDSS